jgi:hypothetical protein
MKNKAQLNTIILLLTLFIFLVFPVEIIAREQLKNGNEERAEECLSMFMFLGRMVPSDLYLADKKTSVSSKKVTKKNSGNFFDRQERYLKAQESNIQYTEDYRK